MTQFCNLFMEQPSPMVPYWFFSSCSQLAQYLFIV